MAIENPRHSSPTEPTSLLIMRTGFDRGHPISESGSDENLRLRRNDDHSRSATACLAKSGASPRYTPNGNTDRVCERCSWEGGAFIRLREDPRDRDDNGDAKSLGYLCDECAGSW